ncbi:MAG: Holliday junction branch migration protein RuvA [Zetaproteobacteria bacterium]|nr:Holliday junction branch migration protein RuvA [Zetaproteobacteria bacterium]
MIGWLSGCVQTLEPSGNILLSTQSGVGYDVHVSIQTLCTLKVGETANLYIHTYVREDQLALFGFLHLQERALFRQLNNVTGIGARTAMSLLSGMPLDAFQRAIENGDDTTIARTPGIGKKTAQRLILELKGKLCIDDSSPMHTSSGEHADVHSALVNLGYKPAQISSVLKNLDAGGDFQSLLKHALKALS